MAQKRIRPMHPGEYLRDELQARKISLNQLARDTRMPLSRVSAIANGKRSVTADTALRFGLYFKMAPSMWMGFQADYDLQIVMVNAPKIAREVIPAPVAA